MVFMTIARNERGAGDGTVRVDTAGNALDTCTPTLRRNAAVGLIPAHGTGRASLPGVPGEPASRSAFDQKLRRVRAPAAGDQAKLYQRLSVARAVSWRDAGRLRDGSHVLCLVRPKIAQEMRQRAWFGVLDFIEDYSAHGQMPPHK